MTYEEKNAEYRLALEETLEKYLPDAGDGETVAAAMRYSLLGGGKRVRASLTLAVAETVSGFFRQALPAAAAVEMVHAYSLIHDDLPCMDDDALRRGKPACHIAYGETAALLAGDGLLTLAFRALGHLGNAAWIAECVKLLSDAAGYRGMIRGQELDIAAETDGGDMTAEDLRRIHRHKTGALISAAAAMGAVIGGGNQEDCGAVLRYAADIGLAFQIVDDLLDVLSDTETLGKPAGRDREKEKKTYISVLGAEASRKAATEFTRRAEDGIKNRFGDRALYLTELAGRMLNRLS